MWVTLISAEASLIHVYSEIYLDMEVFQKNLLYHTIDSFREGQKPPMVGVCNLSLKD